LNWSAGQMLASGTQTGPRSTIVASGGTLNISPTASSGYAYLDTRALTNNTGGTVHYTTVTSGYNWIFGCITNRATAFANSGSLTVLNRTLAVKPFTNSGSVTVGPGGSASSLTSSGTYTQSGGSTVLADATSTLQAGGAGTVSINGGTLSGLGTVQGTVVG